MGGPNQNRYSACFEFKDELLKFNRREKHILPLVDVAEDDPLDDQRSQGAWNKAINGKPSPDELVEELEQLYSDQLTDPWRYVPEPPPDDPTLWMAQIATRDWWADTLGLERNQVVGWFTGRSKKLDGVIPEKVRDWYQHLASAASETSIRSKQGDIVVNKEEFLLYARRLMEDGIDITDEHIKQMVAAFYKEPTIIDWADPKCGYVQDFDEGNDTQTFFYENALRWLEAAKANDWEGVETSLPPDGVWENEVEVEKQWGGAYADPHGLNEDLYYKHHVDRFRHVWDQDRRLYRVTDYRVVKVLEDGVWRAPTDREAQGWDEGTRFFWAELREERDRYAT